MDHFSCLYFMVQNIKQSHDHMIWNTTLGSMNQLSSYGMPQKYLLVYWFQYIGWVSILYSWSGPCVTSATVITLCLMTFEQHHPHFVMALCTQVIWGPVI